MPEAPAFEGSEFESCVSKTTESEATPLEGPVPEDSELGGSSFEISSFDV
jgi:hypothetical protein